VLASYNNAVSGETFNAINILMCLVGSRVKQFEGKNLNRSLTFLEQNVAYMEDIQNNCYSAELFQVSQFYL
jgi:hypothetical protein